MLRYAVVSFVTALVASVLMRQSGVNVASMRVLLLKCAYLTLLANAGFATLLYGPSPALAQSLGSAASFAVLGGAAVTAAGTGSVVNGDVGVSPGTALTGFPASATVVPPFTTHSNDTVASAAQTAVGTLYADLVATGSCSSLAAQLNGVTVSPGIYCFAAAADLAATGTLTLDGAGVYVFQVGSALTANVLSTVTLVNGADPCNVFWQVTSAAILNGTSFAGTVVAQAGVTLGVGSALSGRALTTVAGAVTLSGTNTVGGCSAAVAATPTATPVLEAATPTSTATAIAATPTATPVLGAATPTQTSTAVATPPTPTPAGTVAPSLGAAQSFAVLGGTAVTAAGTGSVVNGDVGVSPGTALTGFPASATVVPPFTTHSNDTVASAAQTAVGTLYADLVATGSCSSLAAQLNGVTVSPGIYCFAAAADLAATGTLTLDGAGVYVFQVGSALTANVLSTVTLVNGADPCNVFWQVTSAAILNGTSFAGTVVAQAGVTLGVGSALSGRALTTVAGAVTLSGTNTVGGCSAAAATPTSTATASAATPTATPVLGAATPTSTATAIAATPTATPVLGAATPTRTSTPSQTPTNTGTPSGILVCDVVPSTGSDLGQFGDGRILNNDVVALFKASLGVNAPPMGSALFEAMDSAPLDSPPMCGGDTNLRNNDVVQCFKVSLGVGSSYVRTISGSTCTSALQQ